MSNDNLQMHQINSTSTLGESSLAHNSQNSVSSVSMAPKSANVQFVSDSPITDPGQQTKVSLSEVIKQNVLHKLESSFPVASMHFWPSFNIHMHSRLHSRQHDKVNFLQSFLTCCHISVCHVLLQTIGCMFSISEL